MLSILKFSMKKRRSLHEHDMITLIFGDKLCDNYFVIEIVYPSNKYIKTKCQWIY